MTDKIMKVIEIISDWFVIVVILFLIGSALLCIVWAIKSIEMENPNSTIIIQPVRNCECKGAK